MIIRNPTPAPHSNARCARCGYAFECGGMSLPFDCWCKSLPALPAATRREKASHTGKRGCLCPACYADELADELAASGGAGASAHPGAAREPSTD